MRSGAWVWSKGGAAAAWGKRQPCERILQMEVEGGLIRAEPEPEFWRTLLWTDHIQCSTGVKMTASTVAQPLVENSPPMLGTSNDLKKGITFPTVGKVFCFSNFAQVVLFAWQKHLASEVGPL